mgnify:CR=1 FL=1
MLEVPENRNDPATRGQTGAEPYATRSCCTRCITAVTRSTTAASSLAEMRDACAATYLSGCQRSKAFLRRALRAASEFGLTAALWTPDAGRAARIGRQLQTGTVFMNRCDYLDPALAWTGVKNSGRGATLSSVGFEHLTRPKSFHLRTEV